MKNQGMITYMDNVVASIIKTKYNKLLAIDGDGEKEWIVVFYFYFCFFPCRL